MIADLHNHYAMHVVSDPDGLRMVDRVTRARRRPTLGDRIRAIVLGIASRLANYRGWDSGPRVTMERLHKGDVRVILAALLNPFDEANLGDPYASPPERSYPDSILRQLAHVMGEIEEKQRGKARFVKNPAELDAALEAGEVALIPAIEGGFHLGAADQVENTVAAMARVGVGYVTLAHLIPRRVATNSNAFPFVSDRLYRRLFGRHQEEGLTELGRAAVESMVRHHVLIDLSHMNQASLDETFDLLDTELDPDKKVPVIASHTVCREPNGSLDYNFTDDTIRRIAERGGVIGLIVGDHLATDGLRKPRKRKRATRDLADSLDVLMAHVEHIRSVTGSHDHTGIGSDLDGFIKPTLEGIEYVDDLAHIPRAVADRYDQEAADAVASGNALRVLRGYWGAAN